MKKLIFPLFFAAANLVLGQTESILASDQAANAYEELPELNASEILRDDILNGPYHKVREEVPTYSGANRFTIDSQFGVSMRKEMKCWLGESTRSMPLPN